MVMMKTMDRDAVEAGREVKVMTVRGELMIERREEEKLRTAIEAGKGK